MLYNTNNKQEFPSHHLFDELSLFDRYFYIILGDMSLNETITSKCMLEKLHMKIFTHDLLKIYLF